MRFFINDFVSDVLDSVKIYICGLKIIMLNFYEKKY